MGLILAVLKAYIIIGIVFVGIEVIRLIAKRKTFSEIVTEALAAGVVWPRTAYRGILSVFK